MQPTDLMAMHFPFRRRALTSEELEWIKPSFTRGSGPHQQTGLLLVHGFTGTPAVFRGMTAAFIERGYTVSCPLLAGHGTIPANLATTTWEDWLHSVEDSYIEISKYCPNIIVIGHSLGGMLALQLAAKHPSIAQLFLIAPAVFPMFYLQALMQIKFATVLKSLGLHTLPPVGGNIKKSDAWEITYPRTPISAIEQFYLCQLNAATILQQVTTPVVVFQSHYDLLVPGRRANELMSRLGSKEKELVWLDNSHHVIPVDNDSENIVRMIFERMK